MNFGMVASTRCLAVAFKQESSISFRSFSILDLFKSFQNANTSYSGNKGLNQALKKCVLVGHIEPFVVLIGGDEHSLRTVKTCWMRAQLHPPLGFRIESIGDAGGLVLNTVPQYASMRVDEIVLHVICQISLSEPTCSESRLHACLSTIYAEMQTPMPSQHSLQTALAILQRAGLVYFCGQGYNLLTPDKLRVANWLRTLPSSSSSHHTPMVFSSTTTTTTAHKFTRGPVRELPTANEQRVKGEEVGESEYTEPKELEMDRGSFSSPNQQAWLSNTRTKNMTVSPGHRQPLYLSARRHTTLNPSIQFGYPGPNQWANWLDATSVGVDRRRGEKQEPVKGNKQVTQSVLLGPLQQCGLSDLRSTLTERHRLARLSKSAEFQHHHQVVALDKMQYGTSVGVKKHSSSPLIDWFMQGVRRLRKSLKKHRQNEVEWHIKSLPMLYQNTTTTLPTVDERRRRPSVQQNIVYREHIAGDHLRPSCSEENLESNILNNLRRCLSLSENQNSQIYPLNQTAAPFSMDVILEAPMNSLQRQQSSSNHRSISHTSFDQSNVDSRLFNSQQWKANHRTAESVLSLKDSLSRKMNVTDNMSRSGSKLNFLPQFPEDSPRHLNSVGNDLVGFFESNQEPVAIPYLARSGRDSGFIENGPAILNHMESSAYSAIHSKHLSEPLIKDKRLIGQMGNACQDLISNATNNINPQTSTRDTWWITGSKEIPSGLNMSNDKRIQNFFRIPSPLQLVKEFEVFPEN